MENNIAKKTYSKIGLSYTLWYFAYLLIMLVCFVVYNMLYGIDNMNGNTQMIINYAIRLGFLYPAMYLAIRKLPKFDIQKGKLGIGGFLASICITYAIMFILNLGGIMLNNYIGRLTGHGQVNPLLDAIDSMSPVVMVLLVVIAAPICEELLFRKFIIDRVVNYGEVTAMLLSGLMFGLYHGNLAQFCYATGLGIFFAFIYIRTGKIHYTICLHMIVNGFTTFLNLVLMKGIDLSEYMRIASSGDQEAITNYGMEHLDVFAALAAVGFGVILVVIAGVILMIVLHNKFVFFHHPEELPKEKKFSTAILNVGMLVFFAYWVFSIVATQFDFSIFDYIYSLIIK